MESGNDKALYESAQAIFSNLKERVFPFLESPEMRSEMGHYRKMRADLGEADIADYQRYLKKVEIKGSQASV